MPPVGMEPTISAGERLQTYALDRAATGTGDYHHDTKVKPEAATAVVELLMMGGKTPETC